MQIDENILRKLSPKQLMQLLGEPNRIFQTADRSAQIANLSVNPESLGNIPAYNTYPDSTFLQDLMSQLYNSDANRSAMAKKYGVNPAEFAKFEYGAFEPDKFEFDKFEPTQAFQDMNADQAAFQASPFSSKVNTSKGVESGLKNTFGVLKNNIKAHPLASAGIGALGAANVAGLVDDNKVAGQLLGSLGGGLASHFLVQNPMAKLAITMGGGTLGALFDKLRAKKEAERAAQEQYAQTYSRR